METGRSRAPKSPYWYTSEPATQVGFRLIRPRAKPATREQQEAAWKAVHPEIHQITVVNRQNNGRGTLAQVNPSLAEEIKKLLAERAKSKK